MGTDRHITYKGKVIANLGRAYYYQDLPTFQDSQLAILRVVLAFVKLTLEPHDTAIDQVEDLQDKLDAIIEECEHRGAQNVIEYMCDDEDMGWIDE